MTPSPESHAQRDPAPGAKRKRGNLKVVAGLGIILLVMSVLVGYSETLYRLFCGATGYAGTTQRVAADDAKISSRTITVRFSTNVAPGLPWRFVPAQHEVTLHLGQDTLAFFDATNLSDETYVGHATFNVTPDQTGIYFKKIQCFCFTEERLGPHQSVEMPVDFFVDPALAKDPDPDTRNIDTITLSYTFLASKQPQGAQDLERFAEEKPNATDGEKIFATRCAECHALHKNIFGPELAGVVGRKAGTVPNYPYSVALKNSGIVWDAASLDKWLSGPQKDVPGALMPFQIDDPRTRQDVIAYLEAESATQQATR